MRNNKLFIFSLLLLLTHESIALLRITDVTQVEDITDLFSEDDPQTDVSIQFEDYIESDDQTTILNEAFQNPWLSQQVRYLNLSGNQLIAPPDISRLVALEYINLADNPLYIPLQIPSHLKPVEVEGIPESLIHRPDRIYTAEELDIFLSTELTRDSNLSERQRGQIRSDIMDRYELFSEDTLPKDLVIQWINSHEFFTEQYNANQTSVLCKENREFLNVLTDIDHTPIFLTKYSYRKLPEPKRNPYNQAPITQTLNLAEAWDYWKDKTTQATFDRQLLEGDSLIDSKFTVKKNIAQQFLRLRGFQEDAIGVIIQGVRNSDYIRVNKLLYEMRCYNR